MAQYQEGQTAVGPNGQRVIYRGGQWVSMGSAPQMPQDPGYQYEAPKAEAQTSKAQADATTAQAQAPFAGTVAQAEARKAEADADLARMKAEEAARDAAKADSPQSIARKDLQTDSVIDRINKARVQLQKGLTSGNFYGSKVFQNVPVLGQDSANLEATLTGLKGGVINDMLSELKALSPSGASGYGSFTETEADRLAASVAALSQTQEPAALLDELNRLERHYRNGRALLNGEDPRLPEVSKRYGVDRVGQPPNSTDKTQGFTDTGEQASQYQLGIEEQYATPQDKKFATLAQAAFDRGASASELQKMARDYGYTAQGFGNLDEAIKYRDEGGQGVRIGAPQSGYLDPGIIERARQNIGASPVGQYFGGAANALSLGFMDEIQGGAKTLTQGGDLSENIAEADLVKSLGANASPKANLLGNVSGGILGALATGGVAGVGPGAVGTFAPRAMAGDALFGAGFGAGEGNDDRLSGAALGAVAGVGGGALGRSAGRRLGGIIGGSSNKAARELRNRGVTLTPGMIGGGSAMQKESRKAGLPGADFPIKQAQERSYDQWNRAVFNEGMDPIGVPVAEIGETGVEEARDAVRKGYSFLDNVGLQEDQQIINALGGRINQARSIPGLGDQTEYSLQKSIDGFFDPETGTLTGRNFQNINQNLTRRAGKLEKSPEAVGPDAADVLRGARDDFGDLAGRQAPEIMPQFRNANQAYGNYKTIQEAVSKGKNTGGIFTPAQLGMAAEQSARKYGGKHGTTERPFFELQRYGQEVLPNTVPDSGTAGRAMTDGVINTGRNALRGITNKALYSEPVLELMNRAAFDRPEALIALGEAMKRRSRLGGLIGAPAFLPAVD